MTPIYHALNRIHAIGFGTPGSSVLWKLNDDRDDDESGR